MTSKEREAMQQALEALLRSIPDEALLMDVPEEADEFHRKAITALREALDPSVNSCQNHTKLVETTACAEMDDRELQEQSVVYTSKRDCLTSWGKSCDDVSLSCVAPHPNQEPEESYVENVYQRGKKYFAWIGDDYVEIYAAPVRTKDLTDDEILDVALSIEIEFSKDTDKFVQQLEDIEVFARAIIEKFKEKNK